MYTFLVWLTNKSAELQCIYSFLNYSRYVFNGREGREERKSIWKCPVQPAILLLAPGSSWKVSMRLGTSTPWRAWRLSLEGCRSPSQLLHWGVPLFLVSYQPMRKDKCVNGNSISRFTVNGLGHLTGFSSASCWMKNDICGFLFMKSCITRYRHHYVHVYGLKALVKAGSTYPASFQTLLSTSRVLKPC